VTVRSAIPYQFHFDPSQTLLLGTSPFFPGEGLGADLESLLERTVLENAGRGLHCAEIRLGEGGLEGATKEFERLHGPELQTSKVRVKEMSGGTKVVLRNVSKDGRPTLEIQHISGERTEIRY
jgi:hypothetical protein